MGFSVPLCLSVEWFFVLIWLHAIALPLAQCVSINARYLFILCFSAVSGFKLPRFTPIFLGLDDENKLYFDGKN